MAFDVFGFGNTLVDILIQVDDEHIAELELKKGTLHLVDEPKMQELLERFRESDQQVVPAGSCANTVFALSSLGADVVLCGKIGRDPHGDLYEEVVLKDRVSSRIKRSPDRGTGRVINLVTPDAERTFVVNLGAAVTVRKEELDDVITDIKNSRILHTEAYVLAHGVLRETAVHLISEAKKSGVRVSLDLSDSGIIERNLDFLRDIVREYVDIAFFNEQEAKIFTGLGPGEAVKAISEMCDIAVVKLGSKGSLVKSKDSGVIRIDAFRADAVDTTGAGDFYAAGFLYGLAKGKDLQTCGRIGSVIAGKVVEQVGARPPPGIKNIPELSGLL
jgi:sugar/nucleoside kinase (ribokinase family)